MKKESIFKKIFSSNKECCAVEFEEVKDNKKSEEDTSIHSGSTRCSSKTE